MEQKILVPFDLKRVISRANKEFGEITKGSEELYNPQLDMLEHYIYNIWDQYYLSDFDFKDVISMIIYDIKTIIEDKDYNYDSLASSSQLTFIRELRGTFDPFVNESIKNRLQFIDLSNKSDLKKLYTLPVICLTRIYESVDFWHQMYGKDGYFRMLEEMVLPFMCLGNHPFILEDEFIKLPKEENDC